MNKSSIILSSITLYNQHDIIVVSVCRETNQYLTIIKKQYNLKYTGFKIANDKYS